MTSVRTLSIVVSIIFGHIFLVRGFVTEENNFVVLKTRDSGTFVGIKEEFPGEISRKGGTSTTNSSLSKTYYAFRGIPYAKPPVGPLRWKEPEPPDLTAGPKDATKFKSNCPQWDSVQGKVIGNLDCLYLNIFTPRLNFNTGRGQAVDKELSPYEEDPRQATRWLPVLIYVYDEDFISGSGDISSYEQFLDENTVLVSFNYRLGIFGFLTSPDESLQGNYGILDQILAMKWIRKNIHRFSGDPNRVTIFGAVSSLLLSPLASDLYQGVILMESPSSIFSRGFVSSNHNHLYFNILSVTDCHHEESQEDILDCLQITTVEDLIEAQHDILQKSIFSGLSIVGPVVNNASTVFPMDPKLILQSDAFLQRPVPILVGVDGAEGFKPFYKFYKSYNVHNLAGLDEQELKAKLRRILKTIFPALSNGAVEDIWGFYFPNFNTNEPVTQNRDYFWEQMLKLFGDVTVYNANSELLEFLSKREAITFNYVFEQNLDKVQTYLESGKSVIGENEVFPWEEKYFLFNQYKGIQENDDGEYQKKNEFMGKTIVKIWTSFAAYRTPKSALAKEKVWGKWVKLSDPADYFHLTLNGSMMRNGFRKKEAEFWKKTLAKVYPPEVVDMDNKSDDKSDVDMDNKSDLDMDNESDLDMDNKSDLDMDNKSDVGMDKKSTEPTETRKGSGSESVSTASPTVASLKILMVAIVIGPFFSWATGGQ